MKDLAPAENLLDLVTDWKGNHYSELGTLHLQETLLVHRLTLTRRYRAYLFEQAILFIGEDLNRGNSLLSRIQEGVNKIRHAASVQSSSNRSDPRYHPDADGTSTFNPKLKGRIYIRHISEVEDANSGDAFTLKIIMTESQKIKSRPEENGTWESCGLTFQDRTTLEQWKGRLNKLISVV